MAYQLNNIPAPTADLKAWSEWVVQELRKVQEASRAEIDGHTYRTLYAEPTKLREGLTVKADGTTWNPSAGGAGLYQYRAGAWVKLG